MGVGAGGGKAIGREGLVGGGEADMVFVFIRVCHGGCVEERAAIANCEEDVPDG